MYNKKLWNVGVVCVILLFWTLVGYLKYIDITTNTLIGKTTDEIIIMCLENTYPEHKFHVVESFDKQKDEGVFADENGLEFKVRDISTYQSIYHFGCDDEYLYEILTQQNYVDKVNSILQKYDFELRKAEGYLYFLVEIDDSSNIMELAKAVKEVLNCVETPMVIFPEDQSFSTGEVNFFSRPKWGMFACDTKDLSINIRTGTDFFFEDKTESLETLTARINETIRETRERHEKYEDKLEDNTSENQVSNQERCREIQTDFGNFMLREDWSKNEVHSTKDLYMYTQRNVELENGVSYFIIGCRINRYTEEEHAVFGRAILNQLMENINIPEGAAIKATNFKTSKGNMVYSFEVELDKDEVMKMHYIIGNKRHCLIQEDNFSDSVDCSNVVQGVIESFEWQE